MLIGCLIRDEKLEFCVVFFDGQFYDAFLTKTVWMQLCFVLICVK
jgi:hypothetical protein